MRKTAKAITAIILMVTITLLSCKKEKPIPPTVKIFDESIAINTTKASVSAEVTDQGSSEVKSRGFLYGLPGERIDTIFCGSGMGVFSADFNNLTPNTSYVYEAFARNDAGFGLSGKVTFTTQDYDLPKVNTLEISNLGATTATISGAVTNDGGASITNRGVCWDSNHTPSLSDHFVVAGEGLGNFTCNLTNLVPNTTYRVRAYATNIKGTAYGEEVIFSTHQMQNYYTISLSSNPNNGGLVVGGGAFQEGQSCTVEATPNDGYNFTNWTENDNVVSNDAQYTFTVNGNRNLVANFNVLTPTIYNINVSANPLDGGTVTGGATYQLGQTCQVTAIANNGFVFTNWTENGNEVSTNANYSFTVNSNRNLVANFIAQSNVPTGAINGLFNVGPRMVYFSKGNLQYQASTNTWRFAEHQYDYIGEANQYASSYYNGWIDLYGWGTSGYNHGAVCYQPWSTNSSSSDYFAYGNPNYHLYDQTGQADWGYNAIYNGGNEENCGWNTLTFEEWEYVFFARVTDSGIRFAKASVNNINGVILLPDDWSSSIYNLSNTNNIEASYSSNTITASQWVSLENAGAVFLPSAGHRSSLFGITGLGGLGYYWSSTYNNLNPYAAITLLFDDSRLWLNAQYRNESNSVRLVRNAQ